MPGGNPLVMTCGCGQPHVDQSKETDVHRRLEDIVMVAKHDAKEHNCNLNIIIHSPVDGKLGDGSTYEIVQDSYFEKERPHTKLLATTMQLGVLVYDEWLPFTEYEKQECDIKLKDGTIVKHCYPNAGSFSPMCADSIDPVPQERVAEIMYRKYYQEGICEKNNHNCNNIEGNNRLPSVADLESELSYMADKEQMRELDNIRQYHESIGLTQRKIKGKIVSVRTEPKIQNNEPCPCGSGKKYKKCCKNL